MLSNIFFIQKWFISDFHSSVFWPNGLISVGVMLYLHGFSVFCGLFIEPQILVAPSTSLRNSVLAAFFSSSLIPVYNYQSFLSFSHCWFCSLSPFSQAQSKVCCSLFRAVPSFSAAIKHLSPLASCLPLFLLCPRGLSVQLSGGGIES